MNAWLDYLLAGQGEPPVLPPFPGAPGPVSAKKPPGWRPPEYFEPALGGLLSMGADWLGSLRPQAGGERAPGLTPSGPRPTEPSGSVYSLPGKLLLALLES